MKVLFVCTGNVCRSFVAQQLLAAKSGKAGKTVQVRSAGTGAQPYFRAPHQVRDFLASHGITGHKHTPSLVTEDKIEWADLVLVMENVHYEAVADSYPQSQRKMRLFLDYCDGSDGMELPDPMGKSDAVFLQIFNEIDRATDRLLEKLP